MQARYGSGAGNMANKYIGRKEERWHAKVEEITGGEQVIRWQMSNQPTDGKCEIKGELWY
jgi:hypothetical protein